ncbi:MAG: tRNA lysidine(34) synthetase TilS [Phycisphaeraceae bacterium]|nr:tRNA lysidine(34) synthetase TilS [Phycisphaeraceae bacterium]MCW5762383.1 tRNA lysidine(34) synthetase TilS [Phycisphaeraceae bacterium]
MACSGGADSAALVLALASRPIVVAHIVHDLREQPQAMADRDATADFARSLGLPFVHSQVQVRNLPGNCEATARAARYRALNDLAQASGCPFVATAHQADDQLETILMRLARGSGLRGLRGILPTRSMNGSTLVRPMLGLSRAECENLCAACGYVWRVDLTNMDPAHTRAAIRASVVPALKQIDSRVLAGAGRTAEQVRRLTNLIEPQIRSLMSTAQESGNAPYAWDRAALRDANPWIVGELVRRAISTHSAGARLDRIGTAVTDRVVSAIQDTVGGVRSFQVGAVTIVIDRERVIIKGNEP